ncbi:hypothetical protein [Microterricola viridarii]|uniref:Uncharacterized protein n=1 Tax=Microterricola viridarii TaxID=412690 RepID=A0A1H1SYS5_9MICO|nr:hypothetical protein [Microterricola viridarii]SDS53155.1 hypothetical protein SAMN04489834_1652 [Microterricola viridarii]
MDLPGFPGLQFVPSEPADKIIDDHEVLTQLLVKRQQADPEEHLWLLVKSDRDQYRAQSAESVRDWIGDPQFPISGHDAVVKLCQVGHQLAGSHQVMAYAVAARRSENHWDTFGLLEHDGQGVLTSKTIKWDGDASSDRVSFLELMLPELRATGSITDEERLNGVTQQQAAARQQLSGVLRELIDHYTEVGSDAKVAELWEERGPLITESLRIRLG